MFIRGGKWKVLSNVTLSRNLSGAEVSVVDTLTVMLYCIYVTYNHISPLKTMLLSYLILSYLLIFVPISLSGNVYRELPPPVYGTTSTHQKDVLLTDDEEEEEEEVDSDMEEDYLSREVYRNRNEDYYEV